MKLIKLTDTLTPDMKRKLDAVTNRKPILERMGQTVKSLAQRAFTDSALRPSTWAPRKKEPKDGHAILQKSTLLRKSINVTAATNTQVTIGSDRPYAAAHQLGYAPNNLPARPFLPFHPDGSLTPRGAQNVTGVLKACLKPAGL